MELLGAGRPFNRWGLVEGSEVTKVRPLKGILELWPSLCLFSHHEVSSFASSCATHHDVLPHHRSKMMGPRDHVLKLSTKISLPSFKLFFSDVLS
jgi:hypothetical protein